MVNELNINETLVRQLVAIQFPKWKDLSVCPVKHSGWDNRTFHLGEEMIVRMPSAQHYAEQVEKEQRWLPILAPFLPLSIPTPLAMGNPALGYPWKWSIYRYLPGEAAATAQINDLGDFATRLANFLAALYRIDTTGGPLAGEHSFYRGGPLLTYDAETRQAMRILKDKIDIKVATEVWEKALATTWCGKPVWVHGDVSVGNLLVQHGQLSGVIDFGQLAVGDPACDLAITWTLFTGKNRETFRAILPFEEGTWARGRAWTLWKALIISAGITNSNAVETKKSFRIIEEVLADHMQNLR